MIDFIKNVYWFTQQPTIAANTFRWIDYMLKG